MFRLARELTPPVIVTASTHLAIEQLSLADLHITVTDQESLHKIDFSELRQLVLITGELSADGRTHGLPPDLLEDIHKQAELYNISVLIEADGSRRLPVKAPADHEPAIPAWVDRVVVVAGLSALDLPIQQVAHRPEQFAQLGGVSVTDAVSEESIVRVLTSDEGGLKNIPADARRYVLLNQVDDEKRAQTSRRMAKGLIEKFDAVLIGAAGRARGTGGPVRSVVEPIAGIILAAGGSERYGQPKVLLDYGGKPFVRVVAEKALRAGLTPVIVVTGFVHNQIERALAGLPVQLVYNPDWIEGQSTSVRAGLRLAHGKTGGAIFLLSDQPQIPIGIIEELLKVHGQSMPNLIAPRVGERRANPVLFDRSTYEDLMGLSGDTGGRVLFDRFTVTWLPWDDERLLMDVDVPEDYQRLMALEQENEE
jgi:molybdenum cofactor cytidylyltransferase